MDNLIKSKFQSDIKDVEHFLENVPNTIINEVNNEAPKIKTESKKIVKNHLTKGNGVDVGIYKKSISMKSLSRNKGEIHFAVGAEKPHYRLSHLLEHGHDMVPNSHFYRHVSRTKAIPHILPAQEYADAAVVKLYEKALDKALEGK